MKKIKKEKISKVKTKKKEVEVEAKKETPIGDEFKWYIVTSTSGKENRTAELIKQRVKANDFQDKILEVIVPTQEKIVIKKGKKQTKEERIFPGYILIKMVLSDETFHLVRNTDGVLGFVGMTSNSKTPSPLSPKEAESILAFTKLQQQPIFEAKFSVNDAVKVVDGPFKEFIGTIQEINESKGQVTVLLSIFDRETPVQLDFLQISKL